MKNSSSVVYQTSVGLRWGILWSRKDFKLCSGEKIVNKVIPASLHSVRIYESEQRSMAG